MSTTAELVSRAREAGQDFEWYPTTRSMVEVVKRHLPENADSIMDIGAGDGRVLAMLAEKCTRAKLYGIEKSAVLVQAQPEDVIPVGTDFYEQNLSCLPVEYIFCNPPYSQFQVWAKSIIEGGFAKKAFLIVPQRWKDDAELAAALKRRKAKARALHSTDFLNAERKARAVVDIVEISYPREDNYREIPVDPFDQWFDQNISTFDAAEDLAGDEDGEELARRYADSNIAEMVAAYDEQYTRMESNYRAIFKLDHALLKELGVSKDAVREGIKKKMAGLKNKYWHILFDRLDAITSRLSTATKEHFLKRLTDNTSVAFTASNAYAVVIWAVKNANRYYDEQLVTLFRELSTFDGVKNYKSNLKTWEKNGWRYQKDGHDHYALDYRIVVRRWGAIRKPDDWSKYDYPGDLSRQCHNLIADIIAVMGNLGFARRIYETPSTNRQWHGGEWQDFRTSDGEVLFQVKGYLNGNLHLRFMPKAIRRLNVEAGRLLGWLQNASEAARELGYPVAEAEEAFGANLRLAPSNVKALTFQAEADDEKPADTLF